MALGAEKMEGLFDKETVVSIAAHNKHTHDSAVVVPLIADVTGWLRYSGWLRMQRAFCRHYKRRTVLALPAQALVDMHASGKTDDGTARLNLELHAIKGTRCPELKTHPMPGHPEMTEEWQGGAFVVEVYVVLDSTNSTQLRTTHGVLRFDALCEGCGTIMAGRKPYCSGCRVACYCDAKCQRVAWPVHKGECGMMARGLKDMEASFK